MCVVDQALLPSGDRIPVKNECPCNCPLGWIEQGCDHLMNYPESAWETTSAPPTKERDIPRGGSGQAP